MSNRDELTEIISYSVNNEVMDPSGRAADAIIAAGWISPADMARIKSEAWDEGCAYVEMYRGECEYEPENPYRA